MIARLQSHPLKRALRADKMTLAALEATLRLYLHPEALSEKLPTLRLLTRSAEVIQIQAQRLQAPLAAHYGAEFAVQVMPCLSQIGSGSLPVDRLPSAALTFTPHDGRGSHLESLAARWRELPVPAITGVNADRLPEEKKRGMTIDLGYAYWPQPDGRVPGFIDVPGHEKFLSNMLAGVGGIDHALLVVACDDGVMAQTREHLAILQLTGNPMLTVALTKADRVDEARVDEVERQVKEVLREYGFAEAKLFITAATEGRGIDALREHLLQLPEREHASQHSFRLAIDRAFTVKGAGLVVTGTALSGEVKVGDSLWLTGVNKPMRVRALHAQNQPTETAHAGQRIALNIAGDAEKEQINRGDWLLADVPPEPFTRVIVELQTHTPLTQWQPLHIHHAASHVTGRVSLLEDNLAELVFDTPLWLVDNDRLVLRDISARNTLAGARVVMLNPPRRGKRKPEYLQWLASLARAQSDADALSVHLERGAVNLADFAWARQLNGEGMRELLQQPGYIQAGYSLLNASVAARWQRKILDTLATYHEQHRDEPGPGRERLRRVGRKLAIQILEYFDRIGFTRRRGNDHLLRDALLFPIFSGND
uniref:Selenocysteine-specific elongation factor n=1 Tax=Panagrolaimus superbus TaxID=310955 RepID=A0A914YQW5_9BILA